MVQVSRLVSNFHKLNAFAIGNELKPTPGKL